MRKLIYALLLFNLGFSTAVNAQRSTDWSKVWKSELERNYLRLDGGTQAAVMAVYQQLGFRPQFVFFEDQYKIDALLRLTNSVSEHGLSPQDYQFLRIANSNLGDSEREIRLVIEVLRLAQDLSAGRVDPRKVAAHVRYEPKGLTKIREVAELILQPSSTTLDALAPKYKGYFELKMLLTRGGLTPIEREKVILSMEKFRWLPDAPAMRYLIVNTSSTMMRLEDPQLGFGSRLKYQKVITGKSSRPTPSMPDAIKYVVLNPTWSVAANEKIWNEDKLPKLKEAFSNAESQMIGTGASGVEAYLSSHGYSLISISDYKTPVSPYSIDWANLSAGVPVNFFVRQQAGDDNALGVVKFPLAYNKSAIYLHDTGSRHLFANEDRNLSSGCVRVQNPIDLAAYLLDGSKWDISSILNFTEYAPQDNRKEKYENLSGNRKNLPVYIMSMTAESVDGQVKFSRDIYGEDAGLKNELLRTGYSL